jgi:formylglycine-generating enzyme required for sulfatase activity
MGQEGESDNPPQWRSIEPFRLQRGPVTVAQFGLFDAHYRTLHAQHLTQYAPKSDCPAIDVNWWDAWVYCRWLGPGFRLPTEVEWEYACRAGRDRSEDLFGVGNGRELAKRDANFSRSVGQTTPVGQYSPNDWQFVDLHGNVWEWCGDWYNATWLQRLTSSVSQPVAADGGPAVGSARVMRGGSWDHFGIYLFSAHRGRRPPDDRYFDVGFRVCWRGE